MTTTTTTTTMKAKERRRRRRKRRNDGKTGTQKDATKAMESESTEQASATTSKRMWYSSMNASAMGSLAQVEPFVRASLHAHPSAFVLPVLLHSLQRSDAECNDATTALLE